MIRVVVVDSGIDGEHPAVRGRATVVRGPAFGCADEPEPDVLGHGTAVAATVLRFLPQSPSEVELVALRVFAREPVCTFDAVLAALEHALSVQPALVNLSLGTTSLRHRRALEALLARALAQGTRLVAPASYGGLPCDPGALPGVEAVVADPNVLPMAPELRPIDGRLIWFASPLPPRDVDGGRRLLARGDSLATAAVTGCLVRHRLA